MHRALWFLLFLVPPALAVEGIPGLDLRGTPPVRIKLAVSHVKEVERDTMEVVFRAEAEERDLKRLAAMVKDLVSWAVGIAQESPYLQVSTGDYQVYAIFDRYDPQRFSHWWGVQLVRIQSTQKDAIKGLIGRLQGKLSLLAIRHKLSPKARHQAEERLLEEALDAFRARADLLKSRLRARDYAILDLTVAPVEEEVAEEAAPFERLSVTLKGEVELH